MPTLLSTSIPTTLEERAQYGQELRVEASWDAFLDAVAESEYSMQYDDGQIISFTGYGTEAHEKLVIRIGHLLTQLLGLAEYDIFGSNLAISTPNEAKRYFNADVTVVRGEAERRFLNGNMSAITNPVLLVEILSASTLNFDVGQKFMRYKHIPALQQVLYANSMKPQVLSYARTTDNNQWVISEFANGDDQIPVLDKGYLDFQTLYKGVKF
ncbi:Uma2 family endonuclease [Phaeodactylibacter xiamenensis]|uniref:Uma2 family endonuclease n=1 Tax=Phaeodactylibacter xiamenensis TaxID=1524460 RepID=UPI0024A995DD|nr:Uma2 family endonuclease [Phaeodactylibacter xiamenensis]